MAKRPGSKKGIKKRTSKPTKAKRKKPARRAKKSTAAPPTSAPPDVEGALANEVDDETLPEDVEKSEGDPPNPISDDDETNDSGSYD